MSYLLLYLDLLVVSAGTELRPIRQTGELKGVTGVRVGTGHRWDKRVVLIKISQDRENVTTLVAHVIPLIFQHL